jgi:hypothetical protein
MAQPNFNLAYERVTSAGQNAVLRAIGNYTAFGPGVDLYLFGFPGSILEQFNLNASYRYFHTDRIGEISYFTGALSYMPAGQQNVSVTFKSTIGKDLNTLVSGKQYTLGLGIKF